MSEASKNRNFMPMAGRISGKLSHILVKEEFNN
jgi:hypothetical protein